MAKDDVILSVFEPILLPAMAPTSMPIMEIIIVEVVNRRIVLGSFSNMMSPTEEEPESLVRNAE